MRLLERSSRYCPDVCPSVCLSAWNRRALWSHGAP